MLEGCAAIATLESLWVKAGYLAISHPDWCEHIQETRPQRCAFWRKDTKAFRAIDEGDPFFVLKKQRAKRPIDERAVIGHAPFERFEVLALDQLAGYYGLNELGVSSAIELKERLAEIAHEPRRMLPNHVGVIQLGKLQQFKQPVGWPDLPSLGIRLGPRVVQGLTLDSDQVERLLDRGLYGP